MPAVDVEQKYAEAWALTAALPPEKQLAFRTALRAARARAIETSPVIGAVTAPKSGTAKKSGEWEWDLTLANWLDGVYTAVSDEVVKTAKTAQKVVLETGKTVGKVSSSVGFGLWPIAVALVGAAWAYSKFVAPGMGKR